MTESTFAWTKTSRATLLTVTGAAGFWLQMAFGSILLGLGCSNQSPVVVLIGSALWLDGYRSHLNLDWPKLLLPPTRTENLSC